jgi:alkaline phosphatase D
MIIVVLSVWMMQKLEVTASQETKIAFGSCNKHQKMNATSIWTSIERTHPNAFVWLGDAVYADTRITFEKRKYFGEKFHAEAYAAVKRFPAYERLAKKARILGTWDDHDYGMNNAGKHWEHKEMAKELFLDFLDEGKETERRLERDGVYESYSVYEDDEAKRGREVQILLLDTRWNFVDGSTPEDGEADILGPKQWEWLEKELMKPSDAEVTLIGSSIQVLAELNQMYKAVNYKIAREFGKSIENWGSFPSNQKRLMRLVSKAKERRVIFLSGDVHVGMIDVRAPGCHLPYESIDATSSGITHVAVEEVRPKWVTYFYKKMTPSKFMPRWWYPKNIVPDIYMGLNFGEVLIHWDKNSLDVNILGESGEVVVSKEVLFSSLEAPKGGTTAEQPTYEECFRERSMSDFQKQWTFHKAAFFIVFPWIVVLGFGLWAWYVLVVKTICCNPNIGRRKRRSKID